MSDKGEQFEIDSLEEENTEVKDPRVDGWLESLIFNDFIEETININDKISIKVRTLTGEQTIDIKQRLATLVSSEKEITKDLLDTKHLIFQLAHALIDINGKPLGTDFEESVNTLKKKPALFLDMIWQAYQTFNEDVSESLKSENLVKK